MIILMSLKSIIKTVLLILITLHTLLFTISLFAFLFPCTYLLSHLLVWKNNLCYTIY